MAHQRDLGRGDRRDASGGDVMILLDRAAGDTDAAHDHAGRILEPACGEEQPESGGSGEEQP